METAQIPTHAPQAVADPVRQGTNRTLIFGGIGALLLAGIAGWFLMSSGSDEAPAPATPAPVAADATPPAAAPLQAQLDQAAAAMERRQYVDPAGTSALDHFRAALAIDAGNTQARAGIRAVADRMIENAEAALLAERLDQAVAALEQARNIQADHPRLAFLDAQLQRERERLQLTQARDVSTRLRGALTQAAQRMEAGRLLAPAGQSARDALVEARRIDPTDPAVIQGFRDLSNRLIDDANRALAAGQRDTAAALVAGARELSPSDARVATLERSLAEPAQAAAARTPAPAPAASINETALARVRLTEGRLLDPAGDSARDHLLAARNADPNDAEAQRMLVELKGRLVDSARQALTSQEVDAADRFLRAATELGVRGNDDVLTAAQRDLERLRADREFRNNIVSAGSLNRTRTVSPDYPQAARRRNIEGWVDLNFTVNTNGTVSDVVVTGSNPAEIFDAAAIEAVRNWRFEPIVRGNTVVPQRAAARLRFDIEN